MLSCTPDYTTKHVRFALCDNDNGGVWNDKRIKKKLKLNACHEPRPASHDWIPCFNEESKKWVSQETNGK